MKRLARVAVAAFVIAGLFTAAAPAQRIVQGDRIVGPKLSPICLASTFNPFAERVWNVKRWERGDPKAKTIAAYRDRLECAPGRGHRKAMKETWRRLQTAYFDHREKQLWRIRVTPFYGCTSIGGCGWWALPVGIVECESGGNYWFPYGAYSILDPAWYAWGGQTAHAGEASKKEQDRVAHYGWSRYGESPWECKSDGSTSWP